MTISTIEESEIPDNILHYTFIKCVKTADGTGDYQLVSPGHHSKMRVVSARMIAIGTMTGSMVGTIQRSSDNTVLVAAMTSGTSSDVEVVGVVQAGLTVDKNDGIKVNVSNAGTAAVVIFVVECENAK